jgi:hypothetical protein
MDLPIEYDRATPSLRRLAREQYATIQRGRCWYCGNPLGGEPTWRVQNLKINLALFPPGFLDHPLHLHHDHESGLTIGTVHARCNAVLWQYEGQ